MRFGKRVVGAGAIAALALVGGTGIAVATGSGDDAGDAPITGSALDKASAAALEHVGGGTVTGTEIDDEESYYEIEVLRADGSRVDVQLDRSFQFVSEKADGEGQQEAG